MRNVSVIFVSNVRWEHIKPPLGASPDPFFIDVNSPNREGMHVASRPYPSANVLAADASNYLKLTFNSPDVSYDPVSSDSRIYHPDLFPFFEQFVDYLLSICYAFVQELDELQYITAACWPAVAVPLIKEITDEEGNVLDLDITLPSEMQRMTIFKRISPIVAAARDELYPRRTNAATFMATRVNSIAANGKQIATSADSEMLAQVRNLPRMSQFILLASYLASTNPAKTDLRMFGRGVDERKKKKGGGTRKSRGGKTSAVAKLPQRLTGPTPFPLDRMLAILGVLLEEYDVETRPPMGVPFAPGERTDLELSRVQVMSAVMELSSMRLVHRTSAPDRLDGPPMFKSGISYDVALELAKQVGLPLRDFIWDPE
jgi:origin recognition complex subunit 5